MSARFGLFLSSGKGVDCVLCSIDCRSLDLTSSSLAWSVLIVAVKGCAWPWFPMSLVRTVLLMHTKPPRASNVKKLPDDMMTFMGTLNWYMFVGYFG